MRLAFQSSVDKEGTPFLLFTTGEQVSRRALNVNDVSHVLNGAGIFFACGGLFGACVLS